MAPKPPFAAYLVLCASLQWLLTASFAFTFPLATFPASRNVSPQPPQHARLIANTWQARGLAATVDDAVADSAPFGHSDITWKLRPPKETPLRKRLAVRGASALIKADCFLRRRDPPPVLCPKGGQAILQAYYRPPGSLRRKQIARFGITTVRGPPAPPIEETVTDVYGNTQFPLGGIGSAAIIYMFVEEEYRKRGIGELALQVISAIHTVAGCDFTLLVADDNGSGKLVEWYERNGFSRAPKLQDMMGSPGGKFGITMIAPTQLPEDFFQEATIKW
mmetsp:Transcript_20250/g.58098  ORF Transcript_20250/g.58098 Transcript_20250/m.58098 type:complete len:277 (-) Transcript_20250:267-1097(-)|eukprot:CAMPEP_0181057958 /NCGR_PEP_ID=MMETSP1070-20121207/20538_1 /TAXON_ID=265543 /ORGANISM="Minutocellus polymorphus, Strain NH13" /LENGTH=276 /DNA_ID=CAMNT_0023137427 /DNA_START=18 /DNA_END=845 /DNA_ORIENTATION=-